MDGFRQAVGVVMPDLMEIYLLLLADGGHQGWWPGETAFEVAVGAVLTQNTSFRGVEKAILALKQKSMLSPDAILAADDETVGRLIRPSGYYNLKTRRLKSLCAFLVSEAGREAFIAGRHDTATLRRMLLCVSGIGRETADSIILYAIGRPIFVVDAYTRRVFGRLGLIEPDSDYDAIRHFFEDRLEPDTEVFMDFHAQIVRLAKLYCRTRPVCAGCPLNNACRFAEGGTVGQTG